MNKPVLTYHPLHPQVKAFSSTRHGGVSQGRYGTFNINEYCGDNPDHVRCNRERLCTLLGIENDRLLMPHQVHGCGVRQITSAFSDTSVDTRRSQLEGIDALITDLHGVCIGVSTADCIPLLVYDVQHHACAAIHAGWRGTMQRIAKHTLDTMHRCFGSEPSQIHAVVGPGIGIDAFEVGDEVHNAFSEAGFDMATISIQRDKWHIDLSECNRQQLVQWGIRPENIRMSGICTYHHTEDYFSGRRLGIASGRIFSGILLTPHSSTF